MIQILSIIVITVGVINLLRMVMLLVGSDIYNLAFHIKKRGKKVLNFPTISIVIPAFNEEKTIIQCVSSILSSNYPKEKTEIIVVDDGSSDKTALKVEKFKNLHNIKNLIVITQNNLGKAHALNNGMMNFASGELVMCLDADSKLSKDALSKASVYFQDEKVVALATNVKIDKNKGLLNLLQMYEYIVCYQTKRAQTIFNIEYIIGGIGSMFRKSFIEQIGYYDANTVTEDIDITMKILQNGNRKVKVMYAADVITYTQGALTVSDLIKQRTRWKWGRYQTFLKNKSMFFTNDKKFTKGLTWLYLPFALWNDFAFIFEPIIITYIVLISIIFRDPFTILSAFTVLTFYLSMNILAENTIPLKLRLKLLLLTPFMYVLFYVLSYVEYVALIKSLGNIHALKNSLTTQNNTWHPIKRPSYITDTTY